jgi:septal ring factor EnvC (AmiA/AmiB activator)
MNQKSSRQRLSAAIVTVLIVLAGCALPRWPVQAAITSPFGLRLDGLLPEIHRGVDLGVPTGTEVCAMRSGTVDFAGVMSGYGNVIVLRHSAHTRTLYAHLSELRVREGERVEGHQVIGEWSERRHPARTCTSKYCAAVTPRISSAAGRLSG